MKPRRAARPPQRLAAGFTQLNLVNHAAEFVGQGIVPFLMNPGHGAVKGQTGVDTDRHQVEGIGEFLDDRVLPAANGRTQIEGGQVEAQSGDDHAE